MFSAPTTRRDFSTRLTAVLTGLVLSEAAFGEREDPKEKRFNVREEISHSEESIHQEVVFNASPKRVYQTLTETRRFDKVVQMSGAMRSGMKLGTKPTQIEHAVGGAFTLFGGHILGRHIELVTDQRIVQAWRVANWEPGVYSIARFELTSEGERTRLVFDHAGFPAGEGKHLAEGWRGNYWEPMEKYLAEERR